MIIGLDVGGTHTDVVLLTDQGLGRTVKVTTDHDNLFQTVLSGLDQVMADTAPEQIQRVVLSTTLTTNAIAQGDLEPVGMVVFSGPGIDPAFFRTNEYYFPVNGCIDHRGREIEPIDPNQIRQVARTCKQAGIRHIGVVGKFSVRNPAHELAIADQLAADFEHFFLGHRVSGLLNFPRRIATIYLNAAVYPIHKTFFEAVKASLSRKGLSVPIRILKADGGNSQFAASIDFPGQTILSGPAASIMGSVCYAGAPCESVVLDIGGTTTDMAVLIDRTPLLAPQGAVFGPYKTLIRALDTQSIGLGGDSSIEVSEGALRIGPKRRGPAMAFGGPVPTPTDALVVSNRLTEGDRERARAGLEAVARCLGLATETAAERIFEQSCRQILAAIDDLVQRINSQPVYTVHEMREGHQVHPRELLVLGGPAPQFAEGLAALSAYRVRVVPNWKVANAIGTALARTTSEITLLADTAREIATAPEENYYQYIHSGFSVADARKAAFDLLRTKAVAAGADPDHLEMGVIEEMSLNMVRGFNTIGKNIRVKVQVKPGLIYGHARLLGLPD